MLKLFFLRLGSLFKLRLPDREAGRYLRRLWAPACRWHNYSLSQHSVQEVQSHQKEIAHDVTVVYNKQFLSFFANFSWPRTPLIIRSTKGEMVFKWFSFSTTPMSNTSAAWWKYFSKLSDKCCEHRSLGQVSDSCTSGLSKGAQSTKN